MHLSQATNTGEGNVPGSRRVQERGNPATARGVTKSATDHNGQPTITAGPRTAYVTARCLAPLQAWNPGTPGTEYRSWQKFGCRRVQKGTEARGGDLGRRKGGATRVARAEGWRWGTAGRGYRGGGRKWVET